MSADLSKVEAITSLPALTNAAELKRFLQMCQYNVLFMFMTPKPTARLCSASKDYTEG